MPRLKKFQGANGRFLAGTHWRERKLHWDLDWMVEQYLTKERSASDIANETGITENAVYYWLHKHGIPRRSITEARSVKHWGLEGETNGMFGRTGEANPNWRGGVTAERQLFYAGQEWKEACKLVWKRDKAACQRCGLDCKNFDELTVMHVHHLESFKVVERRADLSNLVLLCSDCHIWVHSNENTKRMFLEGDNK